MNLQKYININKSDKHNRKKENAGEVMQVAENLEWNRKRKKSFRAVVLVLSVLCAAALFRIPVSGVFSSEIFQQEEGELKVHFIDVGQADCILIQSEGENMLIDAGNNDDAQTITSYLHNQGVTELDYVIGTHGHEDHIGSMDTVIEQFEIGEFFLPVQTYETKSYDDVIKAADEKGLEIEKPQFKEKKKLGSAEFLFITPDAQKEYEDLNDSSIGIRISDGKHSFLLCGDISAAMEQELIESRIYLHADVLKISHHGSSDTSSMEFLKRVDPGYVVISCGKDNDFGHPHKATMKKLKKIGTQIYRTDKQGTVVFTSLGGQLTCNTESE